VHPTDVDPGVTLAGRYRVAELLAETPGDGGVAQTWRAVDEVLSRSVVVHVLAADDPRSDHLLEASRRAATAADVRFLRVLDALRDDGVAYVVREWVAGRSLGTILGDGPLPPQQAGLLVREVAEALARAHDQGLSHERLDPDSIVVTDSGSLKIVGLATQAALTAGRGASEADPGRSDALGIGRLLYAALTARWPTGPRCGLGAAPRAADGSLLSPRQCLAGVPRSLDEITERILIDRPRSGTPLTAPREIAAALTETVGVTPIEGLLSLTGASSTDPGAGTNTDPRMRYADDPTEVGGRAVGAGPYEPNGAGPGYRDARSSYGPGTAGPGDATRATHRTGTHAPARPPGGGRPYDRRPRRDRGPSWRRLAGVFVGIVLLAGAGLLAWQLMSTAFDQAQRTPPAPTPTATKPVKAQPASARLEIVEAKDFDPEGDAPYEEHPEDVPLAFDGNRDTEWTTMSYRGNPKLGLLKSGVGIYFDLGDVQEIRRVLVDLLGDGTDVELRVAPEDATEPPAEADGWEEVDSQAGAGDRVTLQAKEPVRTRWVLIWLTSLPPDDGEYRGGIAEISIRR
jgi:hypothetical protein